MNADYFKYLREEIKLEPQQPNLSSNQKQSIKCLLCNNIFIAIPKGKVMNYKKHKIQGCAKCTSVVKNKDDVTRIINLINEMGFILHEPYVNNKKKILISNNKCCNRPWKTRIDFVLQGNSVCQPCNTERKRQFYKDQNEERHKNSLIGRNGFDLYRRIVRKLTRTSYATHNNIINPKGLSLGRSGTNGYHVDHIVSIRYCFDNNIPEEICAHPSNLRMLYWKDNATKWKKPSFFPEIFDKYLNFNSKAQAFINSLYELEGFESFKDFGGFTATLFSEKQQTAIFFLQLKEFNEKTIGSNKHILKIKQKLNAQHIKTIFIFEDEFSENKNLIVTKIKHITNQNKNPIIYARKCIIKEISLKEKNEFLNKNHIQGTSISQINLGAFYNNNLVAVMTFSNPRIIFNKTSYDNIELVRFATDINFRITGISSKLLEFFKKNYSWKEIYSYADMRWSNGNLYEKLGFKLISISSPGYSYIINGKRKHRWGFRKDALREQFPDSYDSNLTEYQNMLKLGYDRIWDCGTIKFVMRNN